MECSICAYRKFVLNLHSQLQKLPDCSHILDPGSEPDIFTPELIRAEILSLPQIALLIHYNEWLLSMHELQELAIKHRGKISESTLRKITVYLNKYDFPTNRQLGRDAKKNIKVVLPYLSGNALESANIDMQEAIKS